MSGDGSYKVTGTVSFMVTYASAGYLIALDEGSLIVCIATATVPAHAAVIIKKRIE